MLVRAARRKVRPDAAQRSPFSLDRLPVTWLCPSVASRRAHATSVAPAASQDTRRPRHALPTLARPSIRALASISEAHQPQADPIPFQGLPLTWNTTIPSDSNVLPDLHTYFNPRQPLVVNNFPEEVPRITSKNGIGGDLAELHQNLHACCRIGRLDRAASLVQRLTDVYTVGSPELTRAHNLYLEALARSVDGTTSKSNLKEMQDWFHKNLIRQEVVPDAETFVIMLQATISSLEGPAMERLVLEFLHIAKQYELYDDVMTHPDFNSKEWAILLELQPDYYEQPVQEEMKGDEFLDMDSLPVESTGSASQTDFVKPTSQKGLGLITLQKSLAVFKEKFDADNFQGTEEEKQHMIALERQVRLEEDGVTAIAERWRAETEALGKLGISQVLHNKSLAALMWKWLLELRPVLENELKAVQEALDKKAKQSGKLTKVDEERVAYGPFLLQYKVDTLATVTILTVMNSLSSPTESAMRISWMTSKIASQLEDEKARGAALEQLSASFRSKKSAQRAAMLSKLSKTKRRFNGMNSSHEDAAKFNDDFIEKFSMPSPIKAKLGAILIEKLLQTATLTITRKDPETGKDLTAAVPAFSHVSSFVQGKKMGLLAMHHDLHSRLRKEPLKGSHPARLPMLVEPRPWSGFREGGFLRYPVPVVRLKTGQADQAQKSYAISAISRGDMDTVLAGLDVLGKTPWKINQDVFRVMLEVWNSGEELAEIAPENPKLPHPEEPKDGDIAARMNWIKEVKAIEAKRSGYHSQRCFQNFQLEIASAFKDETFYFPHNVDFRGRAYPIPALLNHMGADVARGLLVFGRGKELGEVGLRWLKIHVANLFGFDKASLTEREQFVMDHLDDIYDSATNPLNGKRWWLKGEDPWQLLGACFELKAAMDSPDPTRFVSSLPIHQDGTCNGLQHYAALGGDRAGASQVNLEPGDRPADIYTGVAELVKEDIRKEAAKGDPLATFLDGKITRKIVKQTVMTNVYGVTFNGAMKQVLDRLEDAFPDFEPTKDITSLTVLSTYITRKIFRALGSMFTGAHEIQYWLGECAQRISTSFSPEQIANIEARLNNGEPTQVSKLRVKPRRSAKNKEIGANETLTPLDLSKHFKSTVIWTTPLKMPVVQPYRKSKTKLITTSLQNVTLAEPTSTEAAVSKRKQLQAFPPNFIHSLDATHMTLSALKCHELGLTFASVHDSFWTHAADIPVLNTVLRDAFIRMHSEDIIGRLAEEFKARYHGSMYLASVRMDSEIARKVMAWREDDYAVKESSGRKVTKNTNYRELLLEKKRFELLNSEDPEKRKEGEAMVTPASIYEAHNGSTSRSSSAALHNLLGDEKGDIALEAGAELERAEAEDADEMLSAGDEALTENKSEKEIFHSGNARKKDGEGKSTSKLYLWLPLTIPPVPKKGDFDVSRLKMSQYFFS